MQLRRVLLIYKKSSYQLYAQEHGDNSLARALERNDPAAKKILRGHETQMRAVEQVERTLAELGIVFHSSWRGKVRSTRGYDLVIAVGGDGTLLEAAHRIDDDRALMGVNSDPASSVGKLCACTADQLAELVERVLADELKPVPHTRLEVTIDGQPVLGPCLNDVLFAHRSPADMSRFQLALTSADEASNLAGSPSKQHIDWQDVRGSGVWISTATGSTAAIHSAGGKPMALRSRRLQYLLREPYSPAEKPTLASRRGFIEADQALLLVSRMRSARVWADGPHRHAALRYGQTLVVQAAKKPLLLLRHNYRKNAVSAVPKRV